MLQNGFKMNARALILPLLLMFLSGCASLPEADGPRGDNRPQEIQSHQSQKPAAVSLPQGVFQGALYYRERISLLPGAFVRVVLIREGINTEPPVEIAEQIFHPTGQVPIDYRLVFDPDEIRGGFRYHIEGQIFSEDERLLFASEKPILVEPLGAKRSIDLPLTRVPLTHQSNFNPVTVAVSRVFQCGEFIFGTRTGIGEIALYLPEEVLVLSQTRSASGARYQEGDVLFWMKQDRAMLSYRGTFYRQCSRSADREAIDPLEHRPVDFRAAGRQPGWLLEVVSGHNLNFLTSYGQKRVQFNDPEISRNGDKVVFRSGDQENRISVSVNKSSCVVPEEVKDAALMNRSELSQVSVWWNGRHYEGCGAFLK